METDIVFFDDIAAISKQAKALNTETVILARHFKDAQEAKSLKEKISVQKFDFKTCHILLKPDSKELRRFENSADLIAIKGGSVKMNKFAVSSRRVDFLISPCTSGKTEFDIGIARIAAENKVEVCFLLSGLLDGKPFHNSLLLKNWLLAAKMCKKFKGKCSVYSGANSPSEMRSREDLKSFEAQLGLTSS